jgi:hypothetical protein
MKQLQLSLVLFLSSGVFMLIASQVRASRECTVYTNNQLKYSFNKSLYTDQQRKAISQFLYTNNLNEESVLLDLRHLGEHQCSFAVILPKKQVRWPTVEDVEFAENLKPKEWFYLENNPKQRYYLLPRGNYTESLANPVR